MAHSRFWGDAYRGVLPPQEARLMSFSVNTSKTFLSRAMARRLVEANDFQGLYVYAVGCHDSAEGHNPPLRDNRGRMGCGTAERHPSVGLGMGEPACQLISYSSFYYYITYFFNPQYYLPPSSLPS